MSNAFGFPDWVPWWVQVLALIVGILIALAFMLMPFSVFGVKSRLDVIEARLDELHGEIRVLALRLQDPPRRFVMEDTPAPVAPIPQPGPAYKPPAEPARARPPAPPASWAQDDVLRRPISAPPPPLRQEPAISRPRAEPRLDRYR